MLAKLEFELTSPGLTFLNTATKGEIAHNSHTEAFHIFVKMFLKLSAADWLYVGKGD